MEYVLLTREDFTNVINNAVEAAAEKVASQMTSTPNLMTIEQLIDYLQCSRASINRWIKHNNLPVHYLGTVPRFYKDEIDRWLQKKD